MRSLRAYLKDAPPHRLLLLLMVGCLVVLWLWASLAKIDQQVKGVGSIVPSGQAKVIQHLEGGIVGKIFVSEGQQVEPDQPLFQINDTAAVSDLSQLHVQGLAAELQIRRLTAELDEKKDIDVRGLPADMPPGTIDSERELFQSRTRNFEEELNVLQSQALQKQLKLNDLKSHQDNLAAELKVAQEQYNINDRLLQAGAVSETKYLQSKSVMQDFVTRLSSVEKSIPVTVAELDEVHKHIDETKEKHRGEILDDLKKAQLVASEVTERSKTPSDRIRRTTVTSPIRGVVNKLYINTVDGVVRPGDKLAEIIPLDEKLIVEAHVTTKDRGLIWDGLPAMVKISAYEYAMHGGIPGTVQDISADTLNDEHNVPYYRVRIELSKNQLGKNMPLFPGMAADVNILSGKVTIWQYLVRPLWRIQEDALREAH